MTAPRILVAMAVYDEEQYLDETLPAVLAQTMPDFAFLLMDNGSTDGSLAILRRFRDADPRITLLEFPTNLYPGRIANTVGRFWAEHAPAVRWQVGAGADDVMSPDYLATILAAADAHPTANCIFSPWQWIGHPERGVHRFPAYKPATVGHAPAQIPGWRAVTRALWDAVGGEDETIRIGADWDWAVRAAIARVLVPHQLERPAIALRVREGARKSASDEVDWPALHAHFCRLTRQPVPAWARAANRTATRARGRR